ncbi:hypothetical protein RSP03_01180 [Cereibacter sphaeroides]|jgi:hypothetical protein|nr:hypothetical protein RSP03_01180 [Cereibacter sphaeroides]
MGAEFGEDAQEDIAGSHAPRRRKPDAAGKAPQRTEAADEADACDEKSGDQDHADQSPRRSAGRSARGKASDLDLDGSGGDPSKFWRLEPSGRTGGDILRVRAKAPGSFPAPTLERAAYRRRHRTSTKAKVGTAPDLRPALPDALSDAA